jgi:hypothetical protein
MTSCGNQPLFKDGKGCGACYKVLFILVCNHSSHGVVVAVFLLSARLLCHLICLGFYSSSVYFSQSKS